MIHYLPAVRQLARRVSVACLLTIAAFGLVYVLGFGG
jgi:hypothetical protein